MNSRMCWERVIIKGQSKIIGLGHSTLQTFMEGMEVGRHTLILQNKEISVCLEWMVCKMIREVPGEVDAC